MLAGLSSTLEKYARGWLIFILFLLDTAFMFFILPIAQGLMKMDSGGPGPVDLQFIYTPAKAYEMVASYGEYGRAFYRNVELTVDIIYPIVYTLFFSLLITWLFQRGFPAASRMRRLNVVPFGGWLFDLLENLGIVSMLSVYPSTPALLGWFTAVFTFVKWLFAGTSLLLVVIGALGAVKNGFRRQASIAS
jgi:hypothetical protein